MVRIYYAALIGAAIFLFYAVGVHVGDVRCDARIANENYNQAIIDSKIVGDTNEIVVHTGLGDVRRILRERYTIAE